MPLGGNDDDTPAVTFFFMDEDNNHWKDKLKDTLKKALALLENDDSFKEVVAPLELERAKKKSPTPS